MMPTMRDIAARAGVAPSTVSHVFNGTAPVSEETRTRVYQAAAEMGYKRTHRKRRKPDLVGLIFDGLSFGNRTGMIFGALEYLRAQGVRALVAARDGTLDEEKSIDELAKEIGLRDAQGIIFITNSIRQIPGLLPGRLPCVVSLGYSGRSHLPCVTPDFFQGARDATQHLIRLGHRRILLVNGPPDSKSARDRLEGYQLALEQAGIPYDPELVSHGPWSAKYGYIRVRAALEKGIHFTAVFGGNDHLAIGALDALRERGLRVPDDVAVIGYDNMDAARSCRPQLTSVELPTRRIGQMAAKLLLEQIAEKEAAVPGLDSDGNGRTGRVSFDDEGLAAPHSTSIGAAASVLQIPCPLVIRESCGARPPSEDPDVRYDGTDRDHAAEHLFAEAAGH